MPFFRKPQASLRPDPLRLTYPRYLKLVGPLTTLLAGATDEELSRLLLTVADAEKDAFFDLVGTDVSRAHRGLPHHLDPAVVQAYSGAFSDTGAILLRLAIAYVVAPVVAARTGFSERTSRVLTALYLEGEGEWQETFTQRLTAHLKFFDAIVRTNGGTAGFQFIRELTREIGTEAGFASLAADVANQAEGLTELLRTRQATEAQALTSRQ